MLHVIKLILFAIFIFGGFASDKKENQKLIEQKITQLDTALRQGNSEEHVNSLLNAFNEDENDELIKYLMKENEYKSTALHFASSKGYEQIAKCLLNAFNEEKNDELIKYLMQENINKKTALHFASIKGNETIVNLLLNTFNEENNDELIKFLMQEDKYKKTALHYASEGGQSHGEIVKLLENKTMICKFLKLTQMFQKQNQYDILPNLSSITFGNDSQAAKETILPFLIHDYDKEKQKI